MKAPKDAHVLLPKPVNSRLRGQSAFVTKLRLSPQGVCPGPPGEAQRGHQGPPERAAKVGSKSKRTGSGCALKMQKAAPRSPKRPSIRFPPGASRGASPMDTLT